MRVCSYIVDVSGSWVGSRKRPKQELTGLEFKHLAQDEWQGTVQQLKSLCSRVLAAAKGVYV